MMVARSFRTLVILCLLVSLVLALPRRSLAFSERAFAMTIFPLGTIGFTSLMYYLYKNSPSQRVRGYPENLSQGEYYLALYGGASVMPDQDWTFGQGFRPPLRGLTAQGVRVQPGVVAGLKFGHFFNALPWFGVEMETNYSRLLVRGQNVPLSTPLPTGSKGLHIPHDSYYIWCMQSNLVARAGFRPDKEYPFGRLQPYIGLGTGLEIIYGFFDSAKNFSLATLIGLRYMATANVAVFLEYKFSYQFAVEYQEKRFPPTQVGTVTFDVPNNRIVLGVAWHFKNLFGN